jgi:hypothetical protein
MFSDSEPQFGQRQFARPVLISILCLIAFAAFTSSRAGAGDGSPGSLIGGFLPGATADSAMQIIVTRAAATVRRDLEVAQGMEESARADFNRSSGLAIDAKARVEVKKSELEAIKAREKLLRYNATDEDKQPFESQKKTVENELSLLENIREMRDAEKEASSERRDFAKARAHFHELELDLAACRERLTSVKASQAPAGTMEELAQALQSATEAEKKALSGLNEMTGKQEDAAKAEANLAEHMRKVFDQLRQPQPDTKK